MTSAAQDNSYWAIPQDAFAITCSNHQQSPLPKSKSNPNGKLQGSAAAETWSSDSPNDSHLWCVQSATEEMVARIFRSFPGMEYCDLKRDRVTGQSKVFDCNCVF